MKKYTFTLIRLSNDYLVFQNTEVNEILTEKEVLDELHQIGISSEDLTTFTNTALNSKCIIETTITTGVKRGTRFAYIHRIQ